MRPLVLIPARGGSKGLPQKNIISLNDKPLIAYSIDIAKALFPIEDICISTDDPQIAQVAIDCGLQIPFMRPAALATDQASSFDVIKHALHFYQEQGIRHDCLVLLQPTSPFRKKEHLTEALSLYNPAIDLVVSVAKSKNNPYFNLFEENELGFLEKSKTSNFTNRQEVPEVYRYNGSIYVFNPNSIEQYPSHLAFPRIKKMVMEEHYSIDIDTYLDLKIAELMIQEKLV